MLKTPAAPGPSSARRPSSAGHTARPPAATCAGSNRSAGGRARAVQASGSRVDGCIGSRGPGQGAGAHPPTRISAGFGSSGTTVQGRGRRLWTCLTSGRSRLQHRDRHVPLRGPGPRDRPGPRGHSPSGETEALRPAAVMLGPAGEPVSRSDAGRRRAHPVSIRGKPRQTARSRRSAGTHRRRPGAHARSRVRFDTGYSDSVDGTGWATSRLISSFSSLPALK